MHLRHLDGRGQVSITQHAKTEEWISHCFGEEDASDLGGDAGKGISHTADNNVLEDGGALHEGCSLGFDGEITLLDELIRQYSDLDWMSASTSADVTCQRNFTEKWQHLDDGDQGRAQSSLIEELWDEKEHKNSTVDQGDGSKNHLVVQSHGLEESVV